MAAETPPPAASPGTPTRAEVEEWIRNLAEDGTSDSAAADCLRAAFDALLAFVGELEAERDEAIRQRDRMREPCYAIPCRAESEAAALRVRLEAAERRAEEALDCHAGPGTTSPACGACVSCLHRDLSTSRARIAALEGALRDSASSLTWIGARRSSGHEELPDVLSEIRQYARSRCDVARTVLAVSGTSGTAAGGGEGAGT